MKTITITTYPSMPGRFSVEAKEQGKRPVGRDAANAGEAAAIALQYASGSPRYVILGHSAAVEMIPLELRSKLA